MGNQRIGTLPDTAPWQCVVGLLADGGDAGAVAAATTEAALQGLELARGDEGLTYCTWLLAQVALAARTDDFADALLDRIGVPFAGPPDIYDLIAGFSDAVDRRLTKTASRTDVGEMAQLAAVESLTALLSERASHLFGSTTDDVHRAACELSTQRGFGSLAHDFFARFAQRFLSYHLGRELSQHVGGNGRFADPQEHTAFLEQLAVHCREASTIVREFAGDWYTKHRIEDGVALAKVRGFVNHALTKLRGELQMRGERDG
jgi:hypothetical protein